MTKPILLVLFSHRNHKHGYIEKLYSTLKTAAQGRPFELERGSLRDMYIEVKSNRMQVRESLTGKDLKEFGLVYFELWSKSLQQALAVALYCQRNKVPFFSSELLQMSVLSKVGEIAKMADNEIPLPHTIMTSNKELALVFKDSPPITYPLIVKSSTGFGGRDNYLASDYDELIRVLTENTSLEFVVQEYIPNDCDYRCLVIGNKIVLVMRRSRPLNKTSGSHLNNTSQGGSGEIVPLEQLSTGSQKAVLRAAQVLGRSDFCGVDLMVHSETGRPYILEVNESPQIEIGAAVELKMGVLLDYMEQRMTKEKTNE